MSAELKNLLESFNSLQDDMRATLDKQTAEIKAHGESTEATGKRIAELDKKLIEANAELAERLTKAENEIARASLRGEDSDSETPGAQFVGSDAYKEMIANRSDKSAPMEVKSFFGPARPRADLISTDYPTRPLRVPGIVTPGERMQRVRDLLNIAPTTEGSIEYIEETGFTNNAQIQAAEKDVKGQSDLTFELKNAPVRTIAHWIPATRQVIADNGQLQNYIDGRLLYGLKVREDAQLLYGTGASGQILGLMTNPAVQMYYGGDAVTADAQHTMIDSVRMAMVLTEDAEYPSDGVVLNHRDWAKIETLKGDDGHYLWVNVTLGGQKQLWRVPVVSTSAMTEGEFLVGAFGLAATLWDREQANIRVSDSHSDFFVRNQLVILAEERLALANYRPEAFVNGTFEGTEV